MSVLSAKLENKDLSAEVVDCIFTVHKALGPGLLEKTYEGCLHHELTKRGLKAERQKHLPVYYGTIEIDDGYNIDLLVEDNLIVELKAVEKMHPIYRAQLMT